MTVAVPSKSDELTGDPCSSSARKSGNATPPIGMNVFVLKGVLKDVSVKTIFKGVTPFWVADIFRILLLALIPAISLYLPSMMSFH